MAHTVRYMDPNNPGRMITKIVHGGGRPIHRPEVPYVETELDRLRGYTPRRLTNPGPGEADRAPEAPIPFGTLIDWRTPSFWRTLPK